jgi:hypothetical protein
MEMASEQIQLASELIQFRENLNSSYVTSSTPKCLVEINGYCIVSTINSFVTLVNTLKMMCKLIAMTEKAISIHQFVYKWNVVFRSSVLRTKFP